MPEASSCVSVNHRMVDTPNVVALTPSLAHGDTEDSPRPIPRISRIRDREAAAAAPATIAPQDTALTLGRGSTSSLCRRRGSCMGASGGIELERAMEVFIAREIVLAHGGTISVESSVGAGTVFTMRLPRAPA